MSQSLIRRVKQCTECEPWLEHGVRPVFQCDSRARILIAGQAPGRKVHESGIPFNDASGDRLREWMGIDKTQFYDQRQIAILPMAFCYPGTGKSGDLPPRKECASKWREPMLAALPNIELILVIGKYAQDYHLDSIVLGKGAGVTEIVKNWRAFWPHALPLPHPSPRNNIWLAKNAWFEADVLPTLRARVNNLIHPVT